MEISNQLGYFSALCLFKAKFVILRNLKILHSMVILTFIVLDQVNYFWADLVQKSKYYV